jgi:hypothetical protein
MLRFITYLAFVLCCSVGLTTQSFAEGSCKGEVQATGHGALLESGGKDKAIAAWRNAVVTQYGVFYGEASQANEGKGVIVQNCGRTLIGLVVCLAAGRPCIADSGGATSNELQCERRDGIGCDPTVKWVQAKLNSKGFKLTVDGSAGPATGAAIQAYRRTAKLADGSTIDDALINSLKS